MEEEVQDDTGGVTTSFPWSTFSFDDLIHSSDKFVQVDRFSAAQFSKADLFNLIWKHEQSGIPIIISDLNLGDTWDDHLLSPEWLLQNMPETSKLGYNQRLPQKFEVTIIKLHRHNGPRRIDA